LTVITTSIYAAILSAGVVVIANNGVVETETRYAIVKCAIFTIIAIHRHKNATGSRVAEIIGAIIQVITDDRIVETESGNRIAAI